MLDKGSGLFYYPSQIKSILCWTGAKNRILHTKFYGQKQRDGPVTENHKQESTKICWNSVDNKKINVWTIHAILKKLLESSKSELVPAFSLKISKQ